MAGLPVVCGTRDGFGYTAGADSAVDPGKVNRFPLRIPLDAVPQQPFWRPSGV